jgi:hypothetical protein
MARDGEDEKPAEGNPDGETKRDLRYTEHEKDNVRIERKLDGSGHLTRGDKTNMSILNFSSRHQARTERDPDFEFRPPPPKKPAAEASQAPSVKAEPEPAPPEPTLLGKFKRLLGL